MRESLTETRVPPYDFRGGTARAKSVFDKDRKGRRQMDSRIAPGPYFRTAGICKVFRYQRVGKSIPCLGIPGLVQDHHRSNRASRRCASTPGENSRRWRDSHHLRNAGRLGNSPGVRQRKAF